MKKALILILFTTTIGLAQNKALINNNQQTLSWMGKAAVGSYSPEGTLGIQYAEIEYTKEQITNLSIVIDMGSLEQENVQLKAHLRKKDFFYVDKFPVATFILAEKVAIKNGKAKLTGKMTIRGTANTEVFEALIGFTEETITIAIHQVLDRTHYEINYNSPSIFKKIKENAIADNFVLKGKLVFKK